MRDATLPIASEADWIVALRRACVESSQVKVAQRLGVSQTTLNQVLNGKYPASTKRIEQLVRGALMNESVKCPAVGKLTKERCQDAQDRLKPGRPKDSVWQLLNANCPTCPHSRSRT